MYSRLPAADIVRHRHVPICWGYDIFSGGLAKSAILAILMPHLKVGAQKWTAMANKSLDELVKRKL